MEAAIFGIEPGVEARRAERIAPHWRPPGGVLAPAWLLARREMRDLVSDWRILGPTVLLTVVFPLLMVFITIQGGSYLSHSGSTISLDNVVPFAVMVVGFFPISFSLMVALESFAGEKERNSLEALLASPLSDTSLYLGKIIAALVPPLLSSYLSMGFYLGGMLLSGRYHADWSLLGSLALMNAAAALVMVSSAVLVSSHTTSVRAANLLASFIILPMSVLIQLNNLLVIWGAAGILWLVALGIGAIGLLLLRGGSRLFSRELLLAREMDDLRPGQLWVSFKSFLSLPPRSALSLRSLGRSSTNEPFSVRRLYRHDIPVLLRLRTPELIIVAVALFSAFVLGWWFAEATSRGQLFFGTTLGGDMMTSQVRGGGGFAASMLDSFPPMLLRMVLLGLFLGVLALISFGLLPVLLMMGVAGAAGFALASVAAAAGGSPLVLLAALVSPPVLLPALAFCLFTAFALRIGLSIGSPPPGFGLGDSLLLGIAEFVKISALAIPMLAIGLLIQSFLVAVM